MKRIFFSLPLFSLLLLSSFACESIRTVEVPVEREVTIPGRQIGGNNPLVPSEVFPVDFGAAISAALSQSFSTEGVNKDAVESMKLTKMTATVRDPEENGNVVRHLGFLESMKFSLVDGDSATEIAFSAEGAFAEDPTFYAFELTGAETADILKATEELTMEAEPVLDGRPNFATTVDFSATMTVIIDPLGAL